MCVDGLHSGCRHGQWIYHRSDALKCHENAQQTKINLKEIRCPNSHGSLDWLCAVTDSVITISYASPADPFNFVVVAVELYAV